MIDRKAFFKQLRRVGLHKKLSQAQVDGYENLLSVWEEDFATYDIRFLAYCLATAKHETASTMQPLAEYGSASRANRLYGPYGSNPTRAKRMGNTKRGDGYKYRGRGYVQLTWHDNYKRAGDFLDLDLAGHPDEALRPDIAASILYRGMIGGWFTGRKLVDFIQPLLDPDFHNARRIVNGVDKAAIIAGYATKYEAVLAESTSKEPAPVAPRAPHQTPHHKSVKELTGGVVAAFSVLMYALWELLSAVGRCLW